MRVAEFMVVLQLPELVGQPPFLRFGTPMEFLLYVTIVQKLTAPTTTLLIGF
jgi:hypothetical protein